MIGDHEYVAELLRKAARDIDSGLSRLCEAQTARHPHGFDKRKLAVTITQLEGVMLWLREVKRTGEEPGGDLGT